jgi:prepilin-type N-terminal cleavage/methylation domain-containing protein
MNKKGFTLLEVLITATIFAIMGVGIMYFIAQSNTIMDRSVKQAFAHTNAISALNMLSKDIREGAILESGTLPADDGYTYYLKIRYPDGITEHNWSFVTTVVNEISCKRITRDGVVIPFIGGISKVGNDVIFMVRPNMVGEYFYADIIFTMVVDGKSQNISTVAYCRHDPTGYFDPQDYVTIQ